MRNIPALAEIVQEVEGLGLPERRKAPQGGKPTFSDSLIIGLAVYQKLAGFRYAQQMLEVLASLGQRVPAPSSFAEPKVGLLMQMILAVKHLCGSVVPAVRQHLDSKKLETADRIRANRGIRVGAYGHDHIHDLIFFGFRLQARVDDQGQLCRLLLRPANEHDLKVAPRLLHTLSYCVVTADKGYISKALKQHLANQAVDLERFSERIGQSTRLERPYSAHFWPLLLAAKIAETAIVTPRKSNQPPPPTPEQHLYTGHRRIESVFSALDRSGLSLRPYRSTISFLLHLYAIILAYQLTHLVFCICYFCISELGFQVSQFTHTSRSGRIDASLFWLGRNLS